MNELGPRVIAERLLGGIEWTDGLRGYCRCPGRTQHTTPTSRRDCQVMLDGAPTVYCFHSSCLTAIEAANRELRRSLASGQASEVKWQPTPEDRLRQAERERLLELARRARRTCEQVLTNYKAFAARMFGSSPMPLPSDPTEHWMFHLAALFESTDVVWIGDTKDSCDDDADEQRKAYCQQHFRTVSQWLKEATAPGQFTCPSVFKEGVHSRSNRNVVVRRFLVVESDSLSKEQMLALFAWLAQSQRLRAVVDTAGRSLHGWFEPPAARAEQELRAILPAMGCDPALFKLSQPCRLPGATRGGKHQRLLWLAGKGDRG